MSSSSSDVEMSESARTEAKRAKKELKRKRAAAAEEAEHPQQASTEEAAIAAIEADNEKGAKKRHKKEKKEKKEKQTREDSPASRAASPAPAAVARTDEREETEEERKARKKAKKAAKRARDEEVLAAGEKALQEEEDEDEAERKKNKKAKRDSEAAAATTTLNEDTPMADVSEDAVKAERKRMKKEKKAREAAAAESSVAPSAAAATAAASSSSAAAGDAAAEPKRWPTPPPGNVTLLLFYQYVRPSWTLTQRQAAENFTRDSLTRHGCTGRLRCAREGFNGTLTGSAEGIRAFCQDLREYQPEHFANTDFKLVDGLRDGQKLKGLKVWHVEELVTYGFGSKGVAPIEQGGTHLTPRDWHNKAAEDNTVLIDVRNANENAIGRFQPLDDAERVLDPFMRTSTEFPKWVADNMDKLKKAKNIMMYCTGGIRCERASALLIQEGVPTEKVYQLEGGIHRYLEEFKDGGHWVGKNYTFDRRFSHGATAKTPEVVGRCACCEAPWDRYQAGKKCAMCRMEVLVCRECERSGKMKTVTLKCHLCGGPKPSYLKLPEGDKSILRLKPKKNYADGKAEAEY